MRRQTTAALLLTALAVGLLWGLLIGAHRQKHAMRHQRREIMRSVEERARTIEGEAYRRGWWDGVMERRKGP